MKTKKKKRNRKCEREAGFFEYFDLYYCLAIKT